MKILMVAMGVLFVGVVVGIFTCYQSPEPPQMVDPLADQQAEQQATQQQQAQQQQDTQPAPAAEDGDAPAEAEVGAEEPDFDDGLWVGLPEVTGVGYREVDDNGVHGYFVAAFDRPVTVVGDLKMRVARYTHPDEHIPLETEDFPTRHLRFGPIKPGYFVALRLVPDGVVTVRGNDGRDAVLGFTPVAGILTTTPGIEGVADRRLAGCVFWLKHQPDFPADPVVVEEVMALTLDGLSDETMMWWADRIRVSTNFTLLDPVNLQESGACRDIWSEPAGELNGLKRNGAFQYQCVHTKPEQGARSTSEIEELSRLMGMNYGDLKGNDRMLLRNNADSPSCRRFYPQLFYDRWIPVVSDLYYRWGDA